LLQEKLQPIKQHLEKNQWLGGDELSLADIWLSLLVKDGMTEYRERVGAELI